MEPPSVNFPAGETGSSLLHSALSRAREGYPRVFAGLEVPRDGRVFKRQVPDLLARFEAMRAASRERVEVAELLASHVAEHARWGEAPLADGLGPGAVGQPVVAQGRAQPGWVPRVTHRGQTYVGAAIGSLADRLRAEHLITESAASALRRFASERLCEPLVLEGHTFALLGAGAELAPTPCLLEAGARVLWVDREAPRVDPGAGTLVHYPEALDLLSQAPAIRAAVAREEGAHLGLYAYAPGRGRELLLTTAMNAIAAQVEPASISMLVSPTTPGEVQPEDRADRLTRRAGAPRWQRALARVRLLPEPAFHRRGDVEISRSIVPLQGPTYLAAQYLTKMMVAEAWASSRAPVRISANVAGITHTRSLEHPLFLAGFLGAPAFGIEIFQPEATRVLTTLLMLHDVLEPDAPAAEPSLAPAERARRVAAQSIHGGVRSVPYVFEHTIRVAAVLGLTKQPSLLTRLRDG